MSDHKHTVTPGVTCKKCIYNCSYVPNHQRISDDEMSLDENEEEEGVKSFAVEYACYDYSNKFHDICKKCRNEILDGQIEIAKLEPFGGIKEKALYHVDCLFDQFLKHPYPTEIINDFKEDVEGWYDLQNDHKRVLKRKLAKLNDILLRRKNGEFVEESFTSMDTGEPAAKKAKKSSVDEYSEDDEEDEEFHENAGYFQMPEDYEAPGYKPFSVARAENEAIVCKKCRGTIFHGEFRFAEVLPFGSVKRKAWYHVDCLLDLFLKRSYTAEKINLDENVGGWLALQDDEREELRLKFAKFNDILLKIEEKSSTADEKAKKLSVDEEDIDSQSDGKTIKPFFPDDTFQNFQQLCVDVANESAYTKKTAIVRKMFIQGSGRDGFRKDIVLWCRMLLPMNIKRVYHLQSKSLIKLFSQIFRQSENDMLEHLTKDDIAETIKLFMGKSSSIRYASKSSLRLEEVDEFLEVLSHMTKEDEQLKHFKSIIPKCTPDDLKMIIRLIKRDLRINAGAKHILEAIHEYAYRSFHISSDLENAVKSNIPRMKVCANSGGASTSATMKSKVALSLMTPVLPMLAEACNSVEMAMKKCPNGMLSEVKYDGERVQVHKHGNEFSYFSRSLKPVIPHKVNHFKEYIPKAFPGGDDLILDGEILLIDTKNGKPLPFGSLGVHKKQKFKDANVCIFVFDCLYYNGEVLLDKTMKERRKILEQRMTTIPNRVMMSEVQEVHDPEDLSEMIAKVLQMGLEGLVLKSMDGLYGPGKRHWLKVKKDYLFDGAMADSADLVVLGAWYGTGNKVGMKSIFLMGCYDEDQDIWLTVTKVHSGHNDATFANLQKELDMIEIDRESKLLPRWLKANKAMIPDFVAKDPKAQPVWEITGAEFTNQGVHTADGISIRFPRVTKIRDDKDWSTATSFKELKKLFQKSTETIDVSLLLGKTDNKNQTKKINKISNYIKAKDETQNTSSETRNKQDKHQTNEKEITEVKEIGETVANSENNEAAFYAFVGNDYIEFTADGNPLNWIENRKPKKGLPKNAKPMSQRCETEIRSKGVLGKVCAIVDTNIQQDRRQILLRTIKTLGAEIRQDDSQNGVTHIIHGTDDISITELRKYQSRSARHVSELWIRDVVATSRMQDEARYVVTISGEYCECFPGRKN